MISVLQALSVKQPFATLIVTGVKTVEARTWTTPYRGLLAIHASSSSLSEQGTCDLLADRAVRKEVKRLKVEEDELYNAPRSAIVGMVELTGIYHRRERRQLTSLESALCGTYDPEYAWTFGATIELSQPIPCKGALKLWRPPPKVERKLISIWNEEFQAIAR